VADRLEDYRRKRDADATPEPAAEPGAGSAREPGKRRYVVQEHHATRLHWDLRLEHDGVAVSWAVPNGIPQDPKDNRLAVHTEDHPLEYLEFEGDIPKGSYGAGSMRIWDRGTYEEHKFDDDKVEITFHGERLEGRYGLFPLKKRKGEPPGKDWMIHRMDPPADPTREPMPEHVKPMLARAGALPPDDDRWAFEIKWDGVRALAYSEPGRIRFESRNGNDITASYPELKALNRALSSHHAILDGEVVAFDDDGRPSFGRLQGRMHVGSESAARRRMKDTPVVYVVFDLLWLDGHPLYDLPYEQRRARLRELGLQGAHWQTPDHVVGDGEAVLAASLANGLEGVVAKRLDSPYEPGRRSPCWLKVKNVRREDVVVGGWLPGEGKRRERIGALLVGVPEDGRLRYAGRVGTGFTEAELDRLAKVLEQREDSPFGGTPQPPKHAVYVQPTRVAEVEFTEWTSDGMLRHPSYKGLREEAPASAFLDAGRPVRDGVEVRVGERTLKVTNLDKIMYPAVGLTKRDVIEYYVAVAPAILAHLEGRPLTRVRFPNGVEGKSFFEKQCPPHRPEWVAVAPVPLSKKLVEFCVCEDLPTLVWLANLAALELHTQMHRAEALEQPTTMVFDLDPGPPATVVECCRVALWLQGMFENLGLEAFPKTSGSKGLQVYVPL
jgi:bifunctional non-homologous end joining protein LigD